MLAETTTPDEDAESGGVTVPTRVDAGGGGAAAKAVPGAALAALMWVLVAVVVSSRGLAELR